MSEIGEGVVPDIKDYPKDIELKIPVAIEGQKESIYLSNGLLKENLEQGELSADSERLVAIAADLLSRVQEITQNPRLVVK